MKPGIIRHVLQRPIEAISRELPLEIKKVELTKNIHRGTCLGFEGCRREPANTKQLDVPWDVCTAAKFKMDRVYFVGVNNNKILVSLLVAVAKASRCMTELDA